MFLHLHHPGSSIVIYQCDVDEFEHVSSSRQFLKTRETVTAGARADTRVLQLMHSIRRARAHPHRRGVLPQLHDVTLRPHEGLQRDDPAGHVRSRPRDERVPAQVLQPSGCAPQRAHWGAPHRSARKPDAFRAAGTQTPATQTPAYCTQRNICMLQGATCSHAEIG